MDSFGAIRKLARAKHDEMKGQADGDLRGTSLLAAARRVTGIAAMRVPAQHPLLAGGSGALVGTAPALSIYIDDALDDVLAAYVEAHEFGHIWIETPIELAIVPRSSDPGNPEEHSPTGIRRVEAYSPEELRERHANVFAREFLLPCPEARRRFLLGHSASQIATDLGLPLRLVTQQLAVALLLPEPVDPKEVRSPVHPLDPSQRTAAEFEGAPLLVEAGPGTGKTKTLVGRIEHLLKKGVPAAGILILTFSNKAAREIRERIAKASPAAAGELWAGTFHSFGLELLRKYGDRENLRLPIQILDQADQLRFLEAELAELELDHFLWLSEPAFALRHVLGAISRAKDELFGPDEYAKAAARMLADAGADPKLILKAEKAAEVARVYRHYDMRLRADGVVDFADLINRPIELMRKHPEIRDELRQQYAHVLVDEYQDVNRASAVLLKELAGVGKTLWVVGDARQSIYRFRGAAPTNTTEFEKDYPQGVRKSLSVNYRSRQQIVRTFGTYADHMKVGVGRANNLEARRGPGPNAVDLNVATDKDSEIAGIAATIRAFKAKGVPYRCQAILCRGHSYLQEIAGALEAADIPVLNLGEIFEREEVRDLLAILSFVAEPHRGALMRLATLPRYRMPLDDVRTFLDAARDSGTTPLETLKGARKIERLSTRGQEALAILSADLAGVAFMSRPGELLSDLLFEKGLLRDYLLGDRPSDQQRRLAIHQLLQFAIETSLPGAGDPKRKLLDWIRRLADFGDDRSLRELPTAVDGIDAVRLLTVHMSKGLEFDVVHLPGLGKGKFPFTGGGLVCPPPDGMLATPPKETREEEEECLFFVALSRARDYLSLSRAESYGKQGSNPSPALGVIAGHLPRPPSVSPTWTARGPHILPLPGRPDLRVVTMDHHAHDIAVFDECPRRYLYEVVLGLAHTRQDNGYVRFHRVVYQVLRWLAQRSPPASADEVATEFEARWAEIGPVGHPLESIYAAVGAAMVERERRRPRAASAIGENVTLEIEGHRIAVEIDEIHQGSGSLIVRRIRTGRPPASPDQRLLHALMLSAAEATYGRPGAFQVRYLSTDEEVPITLSGVMDARMKRASEALAALQRGDFPATPSEACPRCPQYFICKALPEKA